MAPTLGSVVPILPVQSLQRAILYYRALGFNAEAYEGGPDYAFLERDACRLHLRHAPDLTAGESPAGIYVNLGVGTTAALEVEFRAAGVAILSPLHLRPWGMLEFVLSDLDGNLLRFGEPAANRHGQATPDRSAS